MDLISKSRDKGIAEPELSRVKLWDDVERSMWVAVEAVQKTEK